MGNNFKNVRNWRSICRKNNTPNEISPGFNTVDIFSMYVWHVHNVETLLKLFSGILGRQLRTFFENIGQKWFWKGFENTESGSKLMLAADSGHDPWTLPTQSASSPPPSPPPHTSSPPPTSTSTSLRKIRTWSQILKPVGNEESRVSQTVPKDAVSGDSLPFLCCQNFQPPDPAALNIDQFPRCRDRAHVHHQPDSSLLWGTYLDSKLLLRNSRW